MLKGLSNVIFICVLFNLLFTTSYIRSQSQKPNILFIAIDDLRPELGCYGNDIIKSPNIDQLASEGVLFSNHFVQVPTCGASRYSLLTGMRPSKRIHLSNKAIEEEISNKPEQVLPESFIHQLKRSGYYTVGIGKISHSADGLVYGYEEDVSDKKELPYSWSELLFNSGKWRTGWNSFFGYASGENRQSLKRQVKPYEAGEVEDEGYVDGLTAQLAVNKLKELKENDQPFFLGVGFFKPHLPFNAPRKYWDLYDRNEIPTSLNPLIPENINLKSLHNSGELNGYQLGDEIVNLKNQSSIVYAKKLNHAYYASISYIDAQVGKILKELKRLELDKNTIVVIWGDHGWHLGDQQVWGKHTLFDVALKSALIIKTPNSMFENITVESIVETVDIYPTLMKLCDIEMAYQTDGEEFTDLLKSPETYKDDVAYSYFKNGISLRTKNYRLTKYFRKEQPIIELYDHINDPNESINIATSKPKIVEKLLPLLEQGNTGIYK